MISQGSGTCATTAGVPAQQGVSAVGDGPVGAGPAPAGPAGVMSAPAAPGPQIASAAPAAPAVRDLRGLGQGGGPDGLVFDAGDLVVVSGLPGSGKSTLIRRAAEGRGIDSQDARDRWARLMPPALPYAVYRPLVRTAHYAGLRRALRSGASLVVHDCGTQTWVRRWLAREALARGRRLHLLLLDVAPETAREGQRERGRGVSGYAFARHRGAVGRLLTDAQAGRLPEGCASTVLLDRDAAGALERIAFLAAPGTE